jgi:hypothetical protein
LNRGECKHELLWTIGNIGIVPVIKLEDSEKAVALGGSFIRRKTAGCGNNIQNQDGGRF